MYVYIIPSTIVYMKRKSVVLLYDLQCIDVHSIMKQNCRAKLSHSQTHIVVYGQVDNS